MTAYRYESAEKLSGAALSDKADDLLNLLGEQCKNTREYVLAYCLKVQIYTEMIAGIVGIAICIVSSCIVLKRTRK